MQSTRLASAASDQANRRGQIGEAWKKQFTRDRDWSHGSLSMRKTLTFFPPSTLRLRSTKLNKKSVLQSKDPLLREVYVLVGRCSPHQSVAVLVMYA